MNNSYDCPLDCATPLLLPALPADPYCELAPNYSQVAQLVIAPCESEDPFIDDTGSAALHTVAIDNTNADNTASLGFSTMAQLTNSKIKTNE